jgi:hypothetical protein
MTMNMHLQYISAATRFLAQCLCGLIGTFANS